MPGVSVITFWRPWRDMRRLFAVVRGYAAADDPRAAAGNLVALVLAWNTPFYPLYLLGAAGSAMWPGGLLTLCVLPLFLAVPAVIRRNEFAGRVMLALTGTGNTLFCTWLLGEASGTQLFLFPCVTLAALLFRRRERLALFGLLALPILAGVVLNGRYPVSPFACRDCGGILWMNALSATILVAFLGVLATGLVPRGSDAPHTRRPESPPW